MWGKLPKDLIVVICRLVWETRKDVKVWKADAPIFAAISAGLAHEVERMLEEDRSLANVRNIHGLTPLMHCIIRNQKGLAQLCLRKMAVKNLDVRDTCGRQSTALHLAAKSGDLAIIVGLLHRGADPTLMDNNGLTPCVYAKNCNQDAAFDILTNQRKPVLAFSLDHVFSFGATFNRETRTLLLCLKRMRMHIPKDVKGAILQRLYDCHFKSKSVWRAPATGRGRT